MSLAPSNASAPTVCFSADWPRSCSHVVFLDAFAKPSVLMYSGITGKVSFAAIASPPACFDELGSDQLPVGFTDVVPFKYASEDYVLWYDSATGDRELRKLDGEYHLVSVFADKTVPGLRHVKAFSGADAPLLVAVDGQALTFELLSERGFTTVGRAPLDGSVVLSASVQVEGKEMLFVQDGVGAATLLDLDRTKATAKRVWADNVFAASHLATMVDDASHFASYDAAFGYFRVYEVKREASSQ